MLYLITTQFSKRAILGLLLFNLTFFAKAQCDFNENLIAKETGLCQPALFKLVVNNAPAGSKFYWEVGKGIQQGYDTFYAYIQNSGKINVNVKIKYANGKVCNIFKNEFLEVFPKPEPQFSISRKKLCYGTDTVTYFDLTKNSVKRSWVIDGTNYYNALAKQTHNFSTTGVKRISMVVEDNNGCRAIKEFDSTAIIYKNVNIDFVADNTSGCVSKKVNFSPIITSNDNKIISYKWLTPGGFPMSQSVVEPDTIVYKYSGKYSVSFQVITDKGCTHTKNKIDYLAFGHIDSMTLKFSDSTICKGRVVTIENKDKTVPGVFTWYANGASVKLNPDNYTFKARYDNLGKYDLTVVYNYNGCEISKNLHNYLRVKGVKSEFTSDDYYHCMMPHTVHFKNKSKVYEPGKMIYQWMYFDNGKVIRISNLINDSIKIKQQGEFDVMLITRHSNGCTDTFRKNKFIRNTPIKPSFDAIPKVGCVDQIINFSQNTPPSSYKVTDGFKWTFYDKDKKSILGFSNSKSPTFSYHDTGFYTVKMIADNGIGCIDSIENINVIEIVIPKINFKIENPVICKNEKLITIGTSEPSRAKFRYFWYLKNRIDNTEIYSEIPSLNISLNNPGEYDFKMVHQIYNGCRDSIVNNDLIKVNGIGAEMKLDTFNGCTPLTVKPIVKINENFHYNNPDNEIKYNWTTSNSENVSISDKSARNPEITFNKTGEYYIYLEVTNSSGCKQWLTSKPVYVGVKADFSISDDVVCPNQIINLNDRSYLLPTSINWILSKDAITNDNLLNSSINIKYNIDNVNRVGLIASKFNMCFDTVYKNIKSIVVKSNFKAIETVMKCSPVYAQFNSKSSYADSLIWNFGDNNKVITTDTFVANIYRNNTGIKHGYMVSLIAKSNEGCSDTLIKKDYIKVVGPVPKFEMQNNIGCEPLNVTFIDKSEDVFTHYLSYDDGSMLDTTIGIHKYNIENRSNLKEEHIPILYAVDSLGCKAEYVSPTPIIVKQTSWATFSVSDSIICQDETITLTDNAIAVTKSNFYKKDSSRNPINEKIVNFNSNGNFYISQVVENTNFCVDSMQVKILVNPNPVANFVSFDSICKQKLITFYNTSKSDFLLTKYNWEVKSYGNSTIYNSKSINHVFSNAGANIVELTVYDQNQCFNTVSKVINVPNPEDIPSGQLSFVSVNNNNSVSVNTLPITYQRFLSANLYNENTGLKVYNTTSKEMQTFVYSNPIAKDTSVCFDYRITDICGYESGIGAKHCTIYLKVENNKSFVSVINWTPYIGWNNTDKYVLYRKTSDEINFTEIATLNSNQFTYTDSGLCNRTYFYYIEAVNGNLISRSNLSQSIPVFQFPPKYTDIKNVSVNEDNSISVKWEASKNSNFNNYLLSRICVETSKIENFELFENYYRDYDVNTNNLNYIYSIVETDKCGNRSIAGGIGKNIVINTTSSSYFTQAYWNTYKSWKNGVKDYTLQIKKNGNFSSVYTSSNLDSIYYHNQTIENIHGAYCYRIMAVSSDLQDTSFSNVSCVISPSTLLIANAFTPNGDGINEKIGVKSIFVENFTDLKGRNFSFRIYNRWGEIVFETNNIDEEWDGYYRGVKAQSGVYIYKIKAMGADNHSYSIEGNISLL
ncbi:MAG: gliding motility-associated C-terminal domain-containing protein [Bacteroidetes bacterium]|nr:gliding motility-associated C-terminal domain-containing protein [Bacteroidota bacterium]